MAAYNYRWVEQCSFRFEQLGECETLDCSPSLQATYLGHTKKSWKTPSSPGCWSGRRSEKLKFFNWLFDLKFGCWGLFCVIFCTDNKFWPNNTRLLQECFALQWRIAVSVVSGHEILRKTKGKNGKMILIQAVAISPYNRAYEIIPKNMM